MARNLVLLLDGTSNEIETDRSNILRLYGTLDKGDGQLVYYHPGVGTFGAPNSWSRAWRRFTELWGQLTGWGVDQNVTDAYRFLVNNYQPDDEIYVFGFSRGAFTARSLCGLVGRIGLLPDEREYTTEDAWAVYRSPEKDPERKGRLDAIAAHAIADVHVRVVGVWDTVGALGIPTVILKPVASLWNSRS